MHRYSLGQPGVSRMDRVTIYRVYSPPPQGYRGFFCTPIHAGGPLKKPECRGAARRRIWSPKPQQPVSFNCGRDAGTRSIQPPRQFIAGTVIQLDFPAHFVTHFRPRWNHLFGLQHAAGSASHVSLRALVEAGASSLCGTTIFLYDRTNA